MHINLLTLTTFFKTFQGVGFKVGKNSPIKYLVLQVHYMHGFNEGMTDSSGIIIHYTLNPLNKLAGVLLLGTGGVIPPLTTVSFIKS